MTIHRLGNRLGLLGLLLLAACSAAPGETITPASETANGPVVGDAATIILPGIYLTEGVALAEKDGAFQAVALMSCQNLMDMFSSGEWRKIGETVIPGLAGEVHWLLLERGEQRLFARAGGSAMPPAIDEANSEGEQESSPEPSFQSCSAELIPVTKQQVAASGALEANGQASLFPNGCAEVDGQASLDLTYEGPDNYLFMLTLTTPLAPGENQLDPYTMENFQVNAMQSELTFFELYGLYVQAAQSGESEDEGPAELENIQDFSFYPGEDFTGLVQVDSLEPFRGSIELLGLVEESSGAAQDIILGFECPLRRATQAEYVGAGGQQIIEVPLAIMLEHNNELSFSGIGLSNVGEVTLEGSLLHSAANRYEGSFSATGEGSYSTYDLNGELCTNSWRGNQTIEVHGTAYGSQMELTFAPSGSATVDFETDCKSSSYQEGSLPHENATLYGQGTPLTLKWPPGSAETDAQIIDNSFEGWIEIWRVEFGPWQ